MPERAPKTYSSYYCPYAVPGNNFCFGYIHHQVDTTTGTIAVDTGKRGVAFSGEFRFGFMGLEARFARFPNRWTLDSWRPSSD